MTSNIDPAMNPEQPLKVPVYRDNTELRENSQAMRNLSSGVEVRNENRDRIDLENSTRRQAEAAITSARNLQADNAVLESINNELGRVQENLETIRTSAENTSQNPTYEREAQENASAALGDILATGDAIGQQAAQLRTINPEAVSELTDTLKNLGEFGAESGTRVRLTDIVEGGNASMKNNPGYAVRSSEEATKQVAAMRNTIATMQGNIVSAAGDSLERGILDVENQQRLSNQEEAAKLLDDVTGTIRSNPLTAVDVLFNNMSNSSAGRLLP